MNRRIDPWLITAVVLLVAIGLVMVYSASAVVAIEQSGDELRYLKRQLIAVAVGLVLCVATAVTPTRIMRRYRWTLYGACIFGLLLTFVPGISNEVKGASRWIGFGSVNFQPSEFAKITMAITLAHYLDRWRGQISDLRVLIGAALIPLPAMGLIIFQPDFGTTAIIGGVCALMLFVAGMRFTHMLAIGGAPWPAWAC
jgi:cell division protein FtsW